VTHDLAECEDDSPTIADFKCDLCAALDDRFALSKTDTASQFAPIRDGDGPRQATDSVAWRLSGASYFDDQLITTISSYT